MATQEQLIAKVNGMCTVLSKMSQKEREATPTGTFGKEYNKFLSQVATAFPELKDILPPQVKFYKPAMAYDEMTITTYAEIHAYYEQLKELMLQHEI